MHFTVIDLISRFTPLPQGHQYALAVIDMLTYVAYHYLQKKLTKLVQAYLVNVYSKFGGLNRI